MKHFIFIFYSLCTGVDDRVGGGALIVELGMNAVAIKQKAKKV